MTRSPSLTRRDFLKLSAAGLCALCLGACARKVSRPEDYASDNHKRLITDFDNLLNPIRGRTAELCGAAEADAILAETRQGYEQLLPQVPYIGGDSNELTAILYQAAGALAFYRAMQAHGRSLEDTGSLIYKMTEALALTVDPVSRASARLITSKPAQDEFRRQAEQSQKRLYPGDWVFNYIPKNGEAFDWGIDYVECGIVKFYQAQGAEELGPILCLGDFPLSQAMDTGLVRTTTLARGGACCDFRFKMGRPIQMDWIPDFIR